MVRGGVRLRGQVLLKDQTFKSQHSAYSVVPRVEPELKDLSDEFRREEGRRREDRCDPSEVGLLVFFPAAGVSDSYDVRVRVIGGDLSARAEK